MKTWSSLCLSQLLQTVVCCLPASPLIFNRVAPGTYIPGERFHISFGNSCLCPLFLHLYLHRFFFFYLLGILIRAHGTPTSVGISSSCWEVGTCCVTFSWWDGIRQMSTHQIYRVPMTESIGIQSRGAMHLWGFLMQHEWVWVTPKKVHHQGAPLSFGGQLTQAPSLGDLDDFQTAHLVKEAPFSATVTAARTLHRGLMNPLHLFPETCKRVYFLGLRSLPPPLALYNLLSDLTTHSD